ncbi:hypothetical protein C4571_01980 [Candidatus Parcubacteria bacterium]|nr:MAG: hypothetical protein C4571_01980 [Candidatus Parcubacteria bacterium]
MTESKLAEMGAAAHACRGYLIFRATAAQWDDRYPFICWLRDRIKLPDDYAYAIDANFFGDDIRRWHWEAYLDDVYGREESR